MVRIINWINVHLSYFTLFIIFEVGYHFRQPRRITLANALLGQPIISVPDRQEFWTYPTRFFSHKADRGSNAMVLRCPYHWRRSPADRFITSSSLIGGP